MKNLLKISLLFTLSLTSCAQEPNPIVDIVNEVGGQSTLNPEEGEKKMAIGFLGSDLFGNRCRLLVAVEEHGGEKYFLTKVDYILHGETLPDIEAEFFRYDLGQNTYSDLNTSSGSLVMAGGLLENGQTVDVKKLVQYEQSGLLKYSLRVDFKADDWQSFTEAIEKVTADSSEFSAFESSLNQVERIIFKLKHAGHYDSSACVALRPTSVEEVEFGMGTDHDDDHDHDHDHDDH